jgi:GNAT superfamily N-acetyltransferase
MNSISPATLDDLPQLADLLDELFRMEPDFKPDRAKQLSGLRAIIEQPAIGRILVARDGSEVLGMVNLLFTISTAEGGRVAVLEDLIVRAQARGSGLGSSLLRAAIDFARIEGLTRITVLTGGDNDGAQRLYRRFGFQPSPMVPMRLHLDAQ